MKGAMPERYRETLNVRAIQDLDFAALSPAQQDQIIDAMIRKYAENDPKVMSEIRESSRRPRRLRRPRKLLNPDPKLGERCLSRE